MAAIAQDDRFAALRRAMVAEQLRARGLRDERVLAAMERVPRHEFVDFTCRAQAYDDTPLPIGEGQTISQPYIVGAMVEALQLAPGDTVLEIGTGSGYEAAVLAELAARVYTVERIVDLAELADRTLRRLGYRNIEVRVGDGSGGLAPHAPYDAIVVSAAAPHVPQPLLEQLAEGGRMILPVGTPVLQELHFIRKVGGEAVTSVLEGCRFVPLIGAFAFSLGQ